MPSLSSVRAANAAFSASYRPTAVFVGGTAGVGEGIAKAFARATKGNAHIVICGRNKQSANRIIASFPRTPHSQYDSVQCDATLMKNVVSAASENKTKITTLNYLVMSQGIMTMNGFDPTPEGIDRKLALHFYSRFKFADELILYLRKAKEAGQDARVMSIFSAGTGSPLRTDDLGLKKNFSVSLAANQTPTYNDLMVDEYSRRHPDMSFIHILPGFVDTTLSQSLHWWMQPFIKVLTAVAATSIEDCGEWMTYPLLSPDFATGAHFLGAKADPVAMSRVHLNDSDRAKLIEHYQREVAI